MPDPLGCTYIPMDTFISLITCLSSFCGIFVLICLLFPKFVEDRTGFHGWFLAIIYMIVMVSFFFFVRDFSVPLDQAAENCKFIISLGE
jgi:hypothetical protein